MKSGISATLESPNPLEVFRVIAETPNFAELPSEIEVDNNNKKVTSSWLESLFETAGNQIRVRWLDDEENTAHSLGFWKDSELTVFQDLSLPTTSNEGMNLLKKLPLEVAIFTSQHYWAADFDYRPPSFGNRHALLGWGCAFKGAGHNRLVSRRYLGYGPWRVIRDEESDITLIQFHDLEVDAQTAMEQAKPGHDRMAKPMEGGFIQKNVRLANPDFQSLYSAEEKMLSIVVPVDEGVSHATMLDMCKVRYYQLLENQPVERVAFVFLQESDARAHLYELWLRELECWTIIKGERVRLDLDYVPPLYEKPDWINVLEQKKS
jgi:hypothetical protein